MERETICNDKGDGKTLRNERKTTTNKTGDQTNTIREGKEREKPDEQCRVLKVICSKNIEKKRKQKKNPAIRHALSGNHPLVEEYTIAGDQ